MELLKYMFVRETAWQHQHTTMTSTTRHHRAKQLENCHRAAMGLSGVEHIQKGGKVYLLHFTKEAWGCRQVRDADTWHGFRCGHRPIVIALGNHWGIAYSTMVA